LSQLLDRLREALDHLRGKGPAAAVALTLDLGEARDNRPFALEAGGLLVETCTGDLYARVNGPNGDGFNLRYTRRILYPFTSLFLTNSAQSGKSARLVLLPTGLEADPLVGGGHGTGLDADLVDGLHVSEITGKLVKRSYVIATTQYDMPDSSTWYTLLTLNFTKERSDTILLLQALARITHSPTNPADHVGARVYLQLGGIGYQWVPFELRLSSAIILAYQFPFWDGQFITGVSSGSKTAYLKVQPYLSDSESPCRAWLRMLWVDEYLP